jgi:hypothetical protein
MLSVVADDTVKNPNDNTAFNRLFYCAAPQKGIVTKILDDSSSCVVSENQFLTEPFVLNLVAYDCHYSDYQYPIDLLHSCIDRREISAALCLHLSNYWNLYTYAWDVLPKAHCSWHCNLSIILFAHE